MIDVNQEMHSLTRKIITEALFSRRMRPDQHAKIERWLPVMLKGATQSRARQASPAVTPCGA
jgi:hypothetical protein